MRWKAKFSILLLMDKVESIDISPEQFKVSIELLQHWIERGFDESAVAVFGVSVEVFNSTLLNGKIINPLYDSGYRAGYEKVKEDNFTYFAYPLLGRFTKNRVLGGSLYRKIKDAETYKGFLRDELAKASGDKANLFIDRGKLKRKYGIERSIKRAKDYAGSSAIQDAFFAQTGIRLLPQMLVNMARYLRVGETDDLWAARGGYEDPNLDTFPEEVDDMKRRAGEDVLIKALTVGVRRRGVLIFLNKEIFESSVHISEASGTHEIIITKNEPLPVSVISGVEILSDADRQALALKPSITPSSAV